MEFEWNIFPGFNTLQLNEEVKCLLYRLGETPAKFTGEKEHYLCRCSTTFPVEPKTMKKNVWQMPNSFHQRTVRPVVMGQSIVLSAIKTEVSLESDDPAYQNFLFQQYEERIEKLSQQIKLSKFCLDAGFLSVVQNGQYFMTKDTGDSTQFNTVACREYTLPREEATPQPKGWIQGNTKIGPVLEVTTSYLQGKHGVEIRIMSLSREYSLLGQNFSWIK